MNSHARWVAYVINLCALAPCRLGFFFALDVYMTRRTERQSREAIRSVYEIIFIPVTNPKLLPMCESTIFWRVICLVLLQEKLE